MKRALLGVFLAAAFTAAYAQNQPPTPLFVCSKEHPAPCAKEHPVLVTDPDPEYSDEAREKKINATLNFWIVVGTDGIVSDITEVKRVGYGLDEKAIEALKRWRFKPGKLEDGTPVPVRIRVEITFRLG